MYVGTNLKYALPVSFASCWLDIRRAGGHALPVSFASNRFVTGGVEAHGLGGRASSPPHMIRAGISPLSSCVILVILSVQFEVALRMGAHGAQLGSLLAHHDVAAVRALPYAVAVA